MMMMMMMIVLMVTVMIMISSWRLWWQWWWEIWILQVSVAGGSGNVPNAPHMSSQFAVSIFWWEGAFGMAGYGVPHQRGTERELEGYMFCCLVVISITICSPNISNEHTFHDVREALAVAWEMVKHFPTQNWMCHYYHYRFKNNLTYHQISHGLPPCGFLSCHTYLCLRPLCYPKW